MLKKSKQVVTTRIQQFKKTKAQHLLFKNEIITKIIKSANIKSDDVVIEIGSGLGSLTIPLATKAKFVYAYEIDPFMINELKKKLAEKNLLKKVKIIQGDFLKANLPRFDKCVSNIPYKISSRIVFKLLGTCSSHNPSAPGPSSQPTFKLAVIMFQKEFAERLAASERSSEYCRLSATTQLLSKTRFLFKVGKNAFTPPPKVDSGVVLFEPKRLNKNFYLNEEDWGRSHEVLNSKLANFINCFGLVAEILFERKNKSLRASIMNEGSFGRLRKAGLKMTKEEVDKWLSEEKFEKIKKEAVEEIELGSARTKMLSVPRLAEIVKFFVMNGLEVKERIIEF